MGTKGNRVPDQGRTAQLIGFLEHDPENMHLLCDAVAAAFDEGQGEIARGLIARLARLGPVPAGILNLEGLAALAGGRHEEAIDCFRRSVEEGAAAPEVRLNLAWALTYAGRHEEALSLLVDEVLGLGASPAGLRIRLLHHLDRLEEAMAEGARFAELHPGDSHLMGTLAAAALDADMPDLARAYAARAGSHHDALSTMGLLLLDEDRLSESAALFDRVLVSDAANPRALLGKGLERLARGEPGDAAALLDRAAAGFGDHLGSWIAAGWAYFIAGDLGAAQARFAHALSIDDGFAETHGGLAVIDIAQGRIEDGRRRAEVALRLDRESFGAALATLMLREREGDAKGAERIRQRALKAPVGIGGKTLADALAARGF
jgi:tetratricopeptide (TPR) repeat protein